jgi:hypothetical protein
MSGSTIFLLPGKSAEWQDSTPVDTKTYTQTETALPPKAIVLGFFLLKGQGHGL